MSCISVIPVFSFFKEKLFLDKLQAEFQVFSNNSDRCFKNLEVNLILCLTSDKHKFWHSPEISSHTVCLLNC